MINLIHRLLNYKQILSYSVILYLFALSCSGGMSTTEVIEDTYQPSAAPIQPTPQPLGNAYGFGMDTAIDGDTIVIRAQYDSSDETGIKNEAFGGINDLSAFSGAAYGYTRTGPTWASTFFFQKIQLRGEFF
jgi:hypothetical protein